MNLLQLIVREIGHHRLNFLLGATAVAAAAGCLSSQIGFLRQHDLHTEQIVAAKEAETRERMAALQEDYRKITKGLGFNVLILPADQNLGDLFANDYASRFMPEEYVQRLATSKVATIQHLLPSLQQDKRELALEIMFNNSPIASAIRFGKIETIDTNIVTGRASGMVSLDESIKRLLNAGRISRDTADQFVSDKRLLAR